VVARRLVETGARYIQVEYQYGPFKGFDMHESGQRRMIEMKRQIDRPIAQLIKDLDERGLLERTLVMISTEFNHTIASAPSAGQEPDKFAEKHEQESLLFPDEIGLDDQKIEGGIVWSFSTNRLFKQCQIIGIIKAKRFIFCDPKAYSRSSNLPWQFWQRKRGLQY